MKSTVVDADTRRPRLAQRIPAALIRRVQRARRYLWQRSNLAADLPRRALFVAGCQRSGTNMFLDIAAQSPRTWLYNEGDRAAFENFRLREAERIERLVAKSPAPTVLFKSLCDSHLADRLLAQQPTSQLLWIFRNYRDVANSAVRMWGPHQRETLLRIRDGAWDELGWRGERLGAESLGDVKRVCRDDLSDHEGAVLFWLLRNRFYFELGLDRRARVLLVRYEDLVSEPERFFARAFDFMDCAFDADFAAGARTTSIGREDPAALHPEIEALAERELERLLQAYGGALEDA